MSQLPEPVPPAQLRASDADRQRVADLLHEAAAEGRLDLGELDDRLSQAYAARTYGELEPLTRDIPLTAPMPAGSPASYQSGVPESGGAVAIMSGFQRKGRWHAARTFTAVAFWGGGEIDLREAVLTENAITIRAFAVMGGVEIVAPEHADVHVTGVGIMGGFDHLATGAGGPGAPTVVVKGFSFWGGVAVKRKATEEELQQRKLERKELKARRRGEINS